MISISDLKFGYSKKKALFEGLNLNVEEGKIIGLLGKNGAGKTSLLKLINGLQFAQGGECNVFNHPSSLRHPLVLDDIFFLPEEFYLPPISIQMYVNVYKPFYRNFRWEQFDDYLKEFALNWSDKLNALSHGQKKKFFLAFGLACNTRLCIFDEPTNGLDIPSKSQFRKIVASNITEDRSIIISTHQVKDVENLIDSVLILESGRIIFNYSTEIIARKLSFYSGSNPRNASELIFEEGYMGNHHYIEKNMSDEDSRIDLESLFNGVTTKPADFNNVINQ